MNKKVVSGAVIAVVALLAVSSGHIHGQFSSLQARIVDLQAQNTELTFQKQYFTDSSKRTSTAKP